MNVVQGYPPNIAQLDEAFKVRGRKGVIFTYGDTIYAPDALGPISPYLRAHEAAHYNRQTNEPAKIEAWWARYIADPEWRCAEEVVGHRAEYKQFCALHRDRNQRSHYLYQIAQRLSGPLYGGLLTMVSARRVISEMR